MSAAPWSGLALDFTDPERGVFGYLMVTEDGGSAACAILDRGDPALISTDRAGITVEESADGGWRIACQGDGPSLELHGERIGPEGELGTGSEAGALLGARRTVTALQASGELIHDGRRSRIEGIGHLTSTRSPLDATGIDRVRTIGVALEAGALLSAWAARPATAKGHDEEGVSALVIEAEADPEPAEELLLSTQYDDEGRHRRATLELTFPAPEPDPPVDAGDGAGRTPGDEAAGNGTPDGDASGDEPAPPPSRLLRGSGTLICGSSLELGDWINDIGFFRWSIGGRPGLGRYDVLRRA